MKLSTAQSTNPSIAPTIEPTEMYLILPSFAEIYKAEAISLELSTELGFLFKIKSIISGIIGADLLLLLLIHHS